ncbi:MAG: N-acetylmuramoyl-L-alanine amidase [Anaerovoracaceae bacterium]|nr:N-acetylmuramoyl-L-alanine amidase [Anaerovoracaceae bacterium]
MRIKITDIIIVVMLLGAVISIPDYKENLRQVWKAAERPTVVIDPGHGGIDGGAQATDGTAEKDINLKISLKLKTLLEKEGVRVVMTRDEDEALYDDGQEGAIRTLKTSDMHERKRIIDDADADLAISVHLNSFTQDSSVKGAQVFYPSAGDERIVEKSSLAAEMIQDGLNKNINTDKKRTELAKDDVYLLREASCPIVITECGFLSNSEDLSNLKKDGFQKKISQSLRDSICRYLEKHSVKTR